MRGFDSRRGLQMTFKARAQAIRSRYVAQFTDWRFIVSLVESFVLLAVAMIANYYAALYALSSASNSVTDVILSNIRTYDVDWIFIWGPIIFWVVLGLYMLNDPRKIPYTIKSVALFVLIRCLFISMTHVAPFPDHAPVDSYGVSFMEEVFGTNQAFNMALSTGADLFFSAHTGVPFLMALVFWKNKAVRFFSLITSCVLGAAVLMGHLHYTIDVAAAFFITFTISHIAAFIFKKDHAKFLKPQEVVAIPVSAVTAPASPTTRASRA